jgi:3-hydroxyacyl-[acyl-carrier-protein] dehydratase
MNELIPKILAAIPQQKPFRFVDELLELDEAHVLGTYRFLENESFYQGHFPEDPVTPGVILIETMAQIGLLPLGILLSKAYEYKSWKLMFSSAEMEFFKPVLPGEKVWVSGKKRYFRSATICVEVSMEDTNKELVAKGVLTGQIQIG